MLTTVVNAQTVTAPQTKPDLSTPEATVRSFVAALSSYDAKRAEDCVFEANRRDRAPLLKRIEWATKSQYKLTVTDVQVEIDHRYAFALINYNFHWINLPDGKEINGKSVDMVKLVNMRPPMEPRWQLLSIDPQYHWSAAQGGSLQMEVTAIAHPELYGIEAKCRQQIKRVSGTLFDIAVNFNGKMAVREKGLASPAGPNDKAPWSLLKRAAATYEDPKSNYYKLREFHCPLDGDDAEVESYAFNDKLDGIDLLNDKLDDIDLTHLTEPANTVLVYEGKDGKLNFHHDSRVFVVFTDGHIELINAEQAKTLRWTP